MTGFIGAGNMATAMISGLVSSGTLAGGEIAVFDTDSEKSTALSAKLGVRVLSSAVEVAENCENVVLSVKPNVLPEVLPQLKEAVLEYRPLVVSIAAGKPLSFFEEYLSGAVRLVRVMPNINAAVGEAVSAFCGNKNATEKDLAFAENMCKSFGTAVSLPEKHFPLFGVIGGSSPAFAYMFIDSLARAAVKNGMPKNQALEICAQAVLGSAKMILESKEHPMELADKVCSPGGTTIEGVLSLRENGFEAAVARAVQAAVEKDKLL